MPSRTLLLSLALLIAGSLTSGSTNADEPETIKVFLLAGQSNMQGQAAASTLLPLIDDPATQADFAHLQVNGEWVEREDVWSIFDFRSRRGGDPQPVRGALTVGHGAIKNGRDAERRRTQVPAIGPELGFGNVVGDHFDEQVILVKAAWGGVAVKSGFLPPGAGGPGPKYTEMINHFKQFIEAPGGFYPEYEEGTPIEIAGFVWFQGWNDGVGGGNPEYTAQLAQLIRDLRTDLELTDLPVVIGELGIDGEDAGGWIAGFREQQEAVAEMPEFQGNVLFVRTAAYWPEPRLNSGEWETFRAAAKENEEKPEDDPTRIPPDEFFLQNWQQKYADELAYTSDRRYHYQGSGGTIYRIGEALGRGMLELLDE